jgi:hypothetical protein
VDVASSCAMVFAPARAIASRPCAPSQPMPVSTDAGASRPRSARPIATAHPRWAGARNRIAGPQLDAWRGRSANAHVAMIARRDVDMARMHRHVRFGHHHLRITDGVQRIGDRRHEPALTCCTIAVGGQSVGKPRSSVCRASTPPVDAPIAIRAGRAVPPRAPPGLPSPRHPALAGPRWI